MWPVLMIEDGLSEIEHSQHETTNGPGAVWIYLTEIRFPSIKSAKNFSHDQGRHRPCSLASRSVNGQLQVRGQPKLPAANTRRPRISRLNINTTILTYQN